MKTAYTLWHRRLALSLSFLSDLSAAAFVAALSAAAWIELPTPAAPSTSPLRANTALALTSGSGCLRCLAAAATDSGRTDTTLRPGKQETSGAVGWVRVGSEASDPIRSDFTTKEEMKTTMTENQISSAFSGWTVFPPF